MKNYLKTTGKAHNNFNSITSGGSSSRSSYNNDNSNLNPQIYVDDTELVKKKKSTIIKKVNNKNKFFDKKNLFKINNSNNNNNSKIYKIENIMSIMTSFNKINNDPSEYDVISGDGDQPIVVKCKLIFTRMGTINTILERFDCHAYIECVWEDDKLFDKIINEANVNKLALSNGQLYEKVNSFLKTFKFDPDRYWTPKTYIDNAIGETKEDKTYRVELVDKKSLNTDKGINGFTMRVYEQKFVKGVFYERLELYEFPLDTQELTITVTSKYPENEVKFIENVDDISSISTEVFLNQQEWHLFNYVKGAEKRIYDTFKGFYRSGFSCSSFIARKPGYYINNAYTLIFLITVLGFVPFSVDVTKPNSRMQVAGVLILTQVNFRWIVTQRIPSVPYLTSIDKYAIGNLFFLVLFACWHAIIGSTLFDNLSSLRETLDMYVLIGFGGVFALYTLFYIFWITMMQRNIKKKQQNKCL